MRGDLDAEIHDEGEESKRWRWQRWLRRYKAPLRAACARLEARGCAVFVCQRDASRHLVGATLPLRVLRRVCRTPAPENVRIRGAGQRSPRTYVPVVCSEGNDFSDGELARGPGEVSPVALDARVAVT